MVRQLTSVATPIAHLVGPGQVKIINERLAFSAHGARTVRLDPDALRAILCYGRVGVTDSALRVMLSNDINIAFMTRAGDHCRGRMVRADRSASLTRLAQASLLPHPSAVRDLARDVVAARIDSQFSATRHYQRHGADLTADLRELRALRAHLQAAESLNTLRGIEGSCSAIWFRVLGRLLQPPWQFSRRVRRPPTDPVNALLSLGYTWLLARVVARCDAAGLEVALGALHAFRPGRPSLACDLMEPLRVPAVDRWVIAQCNQTRVKLVDFEQRGEATRLTRAAFPRILASWESNWARRDLRAALDAEVDRFTRRVRAKYRSLPTPA